MSDSIPVFIDFIEQVYNEKSSAKKGNGGIVLFGHSLGGAFSLSITAEAQNRLPLLGVSVLGCAPVPNAQIYFLIRTQTHPIHALLSRLTLRISGSSWARSNG